MAHRPMAFLSYVRFDDEHENRRLTRFRKRLSGEVRIQTGEDFPIFQDRNDIKWGQSWKERIQESLDLATFLIPIITPGFFKSPACCEELEAFLERENESKRNDLVLPIYSVRCDELEDKAIQTTSKLARGAASHYYADWRHLRFEPFTSPQVGKAFERLAVQLAGTLQRLRAAKNQVTPALTLPKERSSSSNSSVFPTPFTEIAIESVEAEKRRLAKTEPPKRIVDQRQNRMRKRGRSL